ncbi:hypothetical protein G6F22_020075 [Rhizopus arrhizus]|nr:hypothetical protein G6F22_020075 [Rhizopus arrhizus]
MALDEVHRAQRLPVAVVFDGDRLDQRAALRVEQAGDLAEVGLQILGADRLDHFDGDHLVVLALQVPVVLQHDADAVRQAGGADARGGQVMLLARDGGGGDMAAVVAGGMDGEAAPAAADFHHAVAWPQRQFAADGVQFAP